MYIIIRTIPNSNKKNGRKRGKIQTAITHIYMAAHIPGLTQQQVAGLN